MESIILSGTDASGQYIARPQISFSVRSVVVDVPVSGTITDASVTISGALTGAYTFNSNANVTLRFKPNEDIYFTTSNFLSNYNAIINYIEEGDMSSYMQTDRSRGGIFAYSTPWRFRT